MGRVRFGERQLQHLIVFLYLTTLLTIGFLSWRMLLTDEARGWVNGRIAAIILLPGVGLFAPSIWLYFGAIFAVMLIVPRSRIEAIGLFLLIAMTLPLTPYGVTAGATYIVKIDPMKVAALSLLPALRFSRGSANARGLRSLDLLFFLFCGVMITIGVRIPDTSTTVLAREVIEKTLIFAIPFLFLTRSRFDGKDQARLLFYLMTAGFMLSIVALFEMLRHWPLYQSIDAHFGITGRSKTMALRGGLLRSPGPFFDSTGFGVFLAVVTIVVASMRSVFRSPLAHQIAILIGAMGTFSTLARNGWVGLAVGLVLIGVYRRRGGQTFFLAILGFGAFAILAVAMPENSTISSLMGKSGHAAETSDYRENLFARGLPLIAKRPLSGAPLAQLGEELRPDLRSQDLDVDFVNSYLYFALTSGLFGLLIVLSFVVYPILRLFKMRRDVAVRSPWEANVMTGVFASSSALALMLAFTSPYERIPVLAVLLFACARNALALERNPAAQSSNLAPPSRKTLVVSARDLAAH